MGENKGAHSARRAATTSAILDAAEKLLSEQGFEGVSVRAIGQAAGVSHALVHRYLGSKLEIYRAVIARNQNALRDAAGESGDLAEATSRMIHEGLEHHRQYLRILTDSALHGLPFETSMNNAPAVERLVQLALERAGTVTGGDPKQLPPRFVIAAIVALYLGWSATETWVLKATGLPDLDEETVTRGVEQVILGILKKRLPSGEA